MSSQYDAYERVPWHRRSSGMSQLLAVGFFLPVVLWVAVIVCATGDIYYEQKDKDGKLRVWSKANRIAAWIFLGLQTVVLVLWATGALGQRPR